MTLTIPELSLVLLVGASGAGKSTFAATHFSPWEVLSSDHYRGVVSNDPTSQGASNDAFDALEYLASVRLRRGLLTVIDATNVHPDSRKRWVALAKRFHVLPVAVVLDVPPAVSVERNAARPDRDFGARVVRSQHSRLKRGVGGLRKEGFRYVHVLRGVDAVESAVIERPKPWTDKREVTGPFDIVGDIHGCYNEARSLLAELGWTVSESPSQADSEGESSSPRFVASHPEPRTLLFLGDLVDRGPASPDVLELVMDLVDQGVAMCLPGNHEVKLQRWLQGRRVTLTHGLQETTDQLLERTPAFRARVERFLGGLVSHFVLDQGKLVVAHAGMREELAGRASGRVRQFALWGETTGEVDSYGLPVRYEWARDYRGSAAVVYGHTPVPVAQWLNNTICVDTGCVFGGELTALRWPERELVGVPAERVWYEPIRPLQEAGPTSQVEDDGLLHAADVLGGRRIETRFGRGIGLDAGRTAAAVEVVARFAEHPRWLVHLPPTMSPVETSKRADVLEHPDEAFAYYRSVGVERVVLQTKHMGSRAVVVVGRSPQAVAERFGVDAPSAPGIVLSRRGRRFFSDRALEAQLLEQVRHAADASGLFEQLDTDWALLDCELMPWSAKAQSLLVGQYAPVGAAAQAMLADAVSVLDAAGATELADQTRARLSAAGQYRDAYRQYCWPVQGVDDLKLAPFHVLATEGAVHADKTHAWHMEQLAPLAEHAPALHATEWRTVSLDDPQAVSDAVAWWEALTDAGGEGMVVKPWTYLTRHKGKIVQPALKVRGREYLRIIYGPEYTLQLDRLRQRGVRRKRSLAMREFVLGLEGLERFVAREPLRRVHACALGILALEAEPVDPRL
jgi:protein phosphatase